MTDEEIINEMANREGRRADVWILLQRQYLDEEAVDQIELIFRDLVKMCQKDGFIWAFLYVFSLGKIHGIRQERARRAKRSKR